jgi:hypothetical protein
MNVVLVRALLLLPLALTLASPLAAQTNPLLPQIRPMQPGEKPPEQPPEKTAPAAKQQAPPPQQNAHADGMPSISVRGSRVDIQTKDGVTNVYFDLTWRIDASDEPVLQFEGDLLLSDDEGSVHGRVPWTVKDEKGEGLPLGWDERGVGIDTSKSESAHAWFKGAQPAWIHFGFVAKRVTFASGRVVECKDCK